jgi:TonB family protein
VSTKKPGIGQIKKYLQNELDARAMHQLEREAQDDPFLAEAMEGFESAAPDQEANFADLKARLAQRTEPKKERNIWLWRVLPLAACLLIALLVGYWSLSPKQPKQQYANMVKPKPVVETLRPAYPVNPAPGSPIAMTHPTLIAKRAAQNPAPGTATTLQQPANFTNGLTGKIAGLPVYKADTVEYKASNYAVRTNSKVEDVLKRMPGFEVDSAGNVTAQGQTVTKARLNGKDYAGGNVSQAVKSLPADILDKIQVIDDYGDQAARTRIKNGDPTKVLNITTADSAHKRPLAPQEDRNIGQSLTGRVAGVNVLPAPKTITGTVVSKDDGQPLPGAMIRISGSNQAIRTNSDGKFTITVPANSTPTLQVAYIGYFPITVNATGKDLKVQLESNQTSLAEVVVGYGTQKTNNVTASAAEVNATPTAGQKAYDDYLEKAAVMPNGETGTVRVGFTISDGGQPQNVHVISGKNKAMNEKAVQIIENGPRWNKGKAGNEVRLRIRFRKP